MQTTRVHWGHPVFPKNMPSNEIPTSADGLRMPYLILACGQRGCGKSTAWYHLLKQLKKEALVDRVFIISPTCGSPSNAAYFADLGIAKDDTLEAMENASLEYVINQVDEEGKQRAKD